MKHAISVMFSHTQVSSRSNKGDRNIPDINIQSSVRSVFIGNRNVEMFHLQRLYLSQEDFIQHTNIQ